MTKRKAKTSAGKKIAQETSPQKIIVECAREISKSQKSFNFYKDTVKFQKEVHKVDVGTRYLSANTAQEMVMFLSKSTVIENITNPLNSGLRIWSSLLFDESLSAKTMDKKDLYIIKTCGNGKARFDVSAL